jgi:hypothetical protein
MSHLLLAPSVTTNVARGVVAASALVRSGMVLLGAAITLWMAATMWNAG